MLRTLASGLLSLIAIGLCVCIWGLGSDTGSGGGRWRPGSAERRPRPVRRRSRAGTMSVATITVGNQTDKVTKGEVISFLSNYPIPDDDHETVYRTAVEHVVNTKLLLMYLARQKVPVTPETSRRGD